MTRKDAIVRRLEDGLHPTLLEVVDESHQHSVPAGAESHFNVVIVSDAFAGCSRVERHRKVHALLQQQLDEGLHALTLTLLTPAENEKRGGASIVSPACRGGSKGEASTH